MRKWRKVLQLSIKLFALVFVLTLTVTLFAACKTEDAANTGGSSSEKDKSEESGAMKDVKYTVMIRQGIADYPPDGGIAKQWLFDAWESELGITNTDYEVIITPNSDYKTKLNAMIAGGDIPDFFDIDVSDLRMYVENDMVVPIDEMVDQMPEYKKMLESVGSKLSYDNFMIDGQHYGFIRPALPGPLNAEGTEGVIVRKDWLENVGMEEPTTLEELHDVLYAFTYNDPDKNGADDTYGIGGDRKNMFSSVFGAYGLYLKGINSWVEVDGKLVHATVMPQAKEAIAVLRQWYSEGIIDPDKFVIEAKQAKDKYIGEKFGVWEQSIWWANDARTAWEESGQEGKTCAFIKPVSGPGGKFGFPVAPVKTQARVFSKYAFEKKDPERFAEILNLMSTDSPKGLRLTQYGLEGEYYDYDASTDTFTVHPMDQSMYQLGFSNPIRWIDVVDRRWIPDSDQRKVDFGVSNDTNNWLLSEFYGSVPAMVDYPDLYDKLWMEYFTKIVTGASELDEWDTYVEKFYKQGGQELTDQVNEAVNK